MQLLHRPTGSTCIGLRAHSVKACWLALFPFPCTASILRTKSPGSGYGKRTATPKKDYSGKFQPDFKPKLPTGGTYQGHSSRAKSRIVDSSRKIAEKGKKVKEEVKEKIKENAKQLGVGRYGVVWCDAVWCGVMLCGVMLCGVVLCGVV